MSYTANTNNHSHSNALSANTIHEILSERIRKEEAKAAREFAVEFIKGSILLAVVFASLFIIYLYGGAHQ